VLRTKIAAGTRGGFEIDWSTTDARSVDALPGHQPLHLRGRVQAVVLAGKPERVALRLVQASNAETRYMFPAPNLAQLPDAGAVFELTDRAWVFPAKVEGVLSREKLPGETWAAMLVDVVASLPSWPRDPVGVGARWVTKRTLVVMGATVTDEDIFELVALDGDRVTLRIMTARSAMPQTVSDGTVSKFVATGTGELIVDLGAPWPVKLTRDHQNERETSIKATFKSNAPDLPAGGVGVNVKASAKITISVEPTEPPAIAVVPRTDGAYCLLERDITLLACWRFLPDGRWQHAYESGKTKPTELVWESRAPPQHWVMFGDRVLLTWWNHISVAATLSADGTKLTKLDSISKGTREVYAFVTSTLPAP
jgi:hypothetical protein